MIDFYGNTLPSFKTNLHTHTTRSDGTFSPQDVVKRYAAAGYQALCISDHRQTTNVSALDNHGLTLMSGIELHPIGPRAISWHILGVNVSEDFVDPKKETANATLQAIKDSGGLGFIAHPYWLGLRATEILALSNYAGIEVYNSTCEIHNGTGNSTLLWDEMLASCPVNAIAVDDSHRAEDCFHAWTEIIAESADKDHLVKALATGSYYATQGPKFTKLSYINGVFSAEFTPCRFAFIKGDAYRYVRRGLPASFKADPEPELITSIEAKINLQELRYAWVSCRIQDQYGRMAWSNPVYR